MGDKHGLFCQTGCAEGQAHVSEHTSDSPAKLRSALTGVAAVHRSLAVHNTHGQQAISEDRTI